MKQLLFSLLLVTFFVACDKSENPVLENPLLTEIRIKERPCETLEYVGTIGNDFETALDSLRKLKSIASEIIKEPLEVLFEYDNRQFFGVAYDDCEMYSDVLDTKGNYFFRTWYCPEDEEATIEEEDIFKTDKNFKVIGGCETTVYKSIFYTNRLDNDFDSALDSLIRLREPEIMTHRPQVESYDIKKTMMSIDFEYDDRKFYLIEFIDSIRDYSVVIDVIDSRGNCYAIIFCED